MKIMYVSQPFIIADADGQMSLIFYLHTQCSCGRDTSRQVMIPYGVRPIVTCIRCQAQCVLTFPIY